MDAEIVAVPFAIPVTVPDAAPTFATVVSDDVHTGAPAPEKAAPFWSLAAAVNVVVPPTETVGVAGVTDTDVNTGVGPVVVLLLPPHASSAAATLPAAIERTTLRSMA